jgi:hypothetical protein
MTLRNAKRSADLGLLKSTIRVKPSDLGHRHLVQSRVAPITLLLYQSLALQ